MLSCKIKLPKFGALIFSPLWEKIHKYWELCKLFFKWARGVRHTMHALVKNVIDSNGFCPISIKLFQEGEDNNWIICQSGNSFCEYEHRIFFRMLRWSDCHDPKFNFQELPIKPREEKEDTSLIICLKMVREKRVFLMIMKLPCILAWSLDRLSWLLLFFGDGFFGL